MGKGAEGLDAFVGVWDGPWSPGSSAASPTCPWPCPAGLLIFPLSILSFPLRSKTPHDDVWETAGEKDFICLMGRLPGSLGRDSSPGLSWALREPRHCLVMSAELAPRTPPQVGVGGKHRCGKGLGSFQSWLGHRGKSHPPPVALGCSRRWHC